MEKPVENFYSFDFAENLVVNDEDEEKIDFKTLDMKTRIQMMKVSLMRKMIKLSH